MKKALLFSVLFLGFAAATFAQGEFPWQLSGGRRMAQVHGQTTVATPQARLEAGPRKHIIVQSITLHLPRPIEGIAMVTICDATGHTRMQTQARTLGNQIVLPIGLEAGTYFYHVATPTGGFDGSLQVQ